MYPCRKQTIAGEEYVHVDDAEDMLTQEQDMLVFEEAAAAYAWINDRGDYAGDENEVIDMLMQNDCYAFSDYDAMMEYLRENHSEEFEGGGSSHKASSFEMTIGGKVIVAKKYDGRSDVMELSHKHSKDGNILATLHETGLHVHRAYRGIARDEAHDRITVISVGQEFDVPPPLDEAPLRRARATAMWTDDGVTVSARDRGIHTAATLAEAAAALAMPEEVSL